MPRKEAFAESGSKTTAPKPKMQFDILADDRLIPMMHAYMHASVPEERKLIEDALELRVTTRGYSQDDIRRAVNHVNRHTAENDKLSAYSNSGKVVRDVVNMIVREQALAREAAEKRAGLQGEAPQTHIP